MSSFIDPVLPERWNGGAGPPSLSFINSPEFNTLKPQILNDWSLRKVNEFSAHNIRLQLHQEAVLLSEIIEHYLMSKN